MSGTALSTIATAELLRLLPTLLGEERRGMVRFLVRLAEFDRRRGWEALGYGSLWDYCARELRLQKGCIFRRTHTVALMQRFSGVEARLFSGALTMTTLLALEGVLNADNCEELLLLAEWKSKEEVGDLAAARMAPKAVPAPMVRKMPSALAPASAPVPALAFASETRSEAEVAVSTAAVTEVAVRIEPRGTIESTPLGDDRYLFRGVAGRAFREKLRRAQEIESHAVPDGDPIKVLERALDLLIEKHTKRVVASPRAAKLPAKPSLPAPETAVAAAASLGKGRPHIPIAVERAVRLRDGDCCAFELVDGSRCRSRWKTELDHIKAFALGGETSVENLRVVCRSHNALLARRTFGGEVISRHSERPRGAAGSSGGTPGRRGEPLRQMAGPK